MEPICEMPSCNRKQFKTFNGLNLHVEIVHFKGKLNPHKKSKEYYPNSKSVRTL